MSHTQQDQAKLLARVRRLTGQMQALERALLAQAPCADVLQQLARRSVRFGTRGVETPAAGLGDRLRRFTTQGPIVDPEEVEGHFNL